MACVCDKGNEQEQIRMEKMEKNWKYKKANDTKKVSCVK